MQFRRTAGTVLSIITVLGLGACNRSTSPKTEHLKEGQGPVSELISTRPEKSGPLKVIVRLPADPLAKIDTAHRTEQVALIEKQQKDLIAQLAEVSDKIQVVFRYKFLLNGLYLVIPEDLATKVDPLIPHGSRIEMTTSIRRPEVITLKEDESFKTGDLKAHNSVKFIGAEELQAQGFKGQTIRVGVIDTGIDYTHSMLGGSGNVDDYKKVTPDTSSDQFPNAKVIGGYDFAGTEYDAASPNTSLRIPKPDINPLDESGHGSHVAGTIAGIGDGVKSYSGVAPEASLYALKVFGKDGSTEDAVVIAALEFAADPDQIIETADALDVVNLSLGSPYGTPKLLYREAIANLDAVGTVIVASAGNSGDVSYITGAPAVTEEAFSVAASIDDMDHNWHFGAAAFKLSETEEVVTEIAEATFTKPLADIPEIAGKLVYVGKAGTISDEQATQLKGNIALIDRGVVTFETKITNAAKAGAIGVVVINNTEGSPFSMGGGSNTVDIPAVMIGLTPGKSIREKVESGAEVIVNLKTDKKVEKPELIDTLTDFSSRGPRSEDSLIKPEISAPGANIISAKVGGGSEITPMSGTSMAAPHMAGVMALLKQSHKTLKPQELKSLAMLTSKSINNSAGTIYPIAQQGAGRVQTLAANAATITIVPAAISLGRQEIQASKVIMKTITLKNLEARDQTFTLEAKLDAHLQLVSPQSITLKAGEETTVKLKIKLIVPEERSYEHEFDGFILLKDQTNKVYSLPVLALVLKVADISAESLKVHSSSALDSVGSLVTLDLKNSSPHSGPAFLFQLLSQDGRKSEDGLRRRGLSTACDIESVGYRVLNVHDGDGQKKQVLQMALKLYNPLTTWNACEFSIQIDADGDGIADQELAGTSRENVEGLGKGMASVLLDAKKARELRQAFDRAYEKPSKDSEKPVLDFTDAVTEMMDLTAFKQSTLMIVQTPITSLKTIPGQNLRVKVGALSLEQDAIESDDLLGMGWMELPLKEQAQTLLDIPETIEVAGHSQQTVEMTKGEGSSPIIIYYPFNHGTMSSVSDQQSQILPLIYAN
jgi:minor extracellular serine protease Vpr